MNTVYLSICLCFFSFFHQSFRIFWVQVFLNQVRFCFQMNLSRIYFFLKFDFFSLSVLGFGFVRKGMWAHVSSPALLLGVFKVQHWGSLSFGGDQGCREDGGVFSRTVRRVHKQAGVTAAGPGSAKISDPLCSSYLVMKLDWRSSGFWSVIQEDIPPPFKWRLFFLNQEN